jgi:hypothetical protein
MCQVAQSSVAPQFGQTSKAAFGSVPFVCEIGSRHKSEEGGSPEELYWMCARAFTVGSHQDSGHFQD